MPLLANLFWGNVLPSSGMTGLVIEVSPEVPEPADWVVQPWCDDGYLYHSFGTRKQLLDGV